MCSDPGQELVKRDIAELNLNRIVVAACSPNLHEPTFRRAAEDAGLNRFLVQMGNIREQVAWVTEDKADALDKAKAHLAGGHPPRRRPRAAAAAVRADRAPGDGRRRRHRRDPGRLDPGRRRQGSDPRRARAVDRRPHGHVRQDLPHAGLRRLHPHAQDDLRQAPSEDQDADLLHGRVGGGLGGQLPREDPPQAAVYRREPVRGLHAVHRRLRVHQGQVPQRLRSGTGPAQAGLSPFPQAVPPVPVVDPEACLQITRGKCKQTCVEACGERNAFRFDQQERIEEYDVGRDHRGHRLQGLRPFGHRVLRLRQVSQRLHQPGGRAAVERRRADRRKTRAPRRLDAQARGHHPLRGQPRRQLPSLLLAGVLHVRPETRPPGPREDRGRGLQLLHRHPHAGQGFRGVLQPRAERRRAVHPRQSGRHHAAVGRQTGTARRRAA